MSEDASRWAKLPLDYSAPALLDALPGGCLVIDAADRIQFANATFCEWLGYSSDHLLGSRFPNLLSMGGKLFYANLHSVQERLNAQTQEVNYDLRCADSTYLPVAVTSRLIDANLRLYLVQRVHVRRLYEQQLREAKRAAEAATRVKSTFLATMTHELRSPIHAIIGAAEVVKESHGTEDGVKALDILSQSAHNLLGLVNDILDLSKAELAELTNSPIRVDLRHLCQGVLESMRLTVRTGQRIAVDLEYDAEYLGSHYLVDEGKLRRVLVNLLSNAIKFTNTGRVTLSVARDAADDPDVHSIRFAVADTGEGIDPSKLQIIFEPFVQEAAAKRQGLGTGLGLSISRHLTHVMGGSLQAASVLGEGSTFSFVLRVVPTEEAEALASKTSPRTGKIPELSRLRVLVVDDNETNRFLAHRRLKQLGIDPQMAADGGEAIKVADDQDFDVIFMDLRMPDIDGVEATQRIKAKARHAATPIVVMSAGSLQDVGGTEVEKLFSGTIPKPFTADELTALLLDLFPDSVDSSSEISPEPLAVGSGAVLAQGTSTEATLNLSRLIEDFGEDAATTVRREFLQVMHDDLLGLSPLIVAAVRQQDLEALRGFRHRISTILKYIQPEPLRSYFEAAPECITDDRKEADAWAARFSDALQATIRELEAII